MKRLLFLLLAALTGSFAVLVAIDVINFETARIDRWAMIVGFGATAFLLALAAADSSSDASEADAAAGPLPPRPLASDPLPPRSLPPSSGAPTRPIDPAPRSTLAKDIDNAPLLPKRIGPLTSEPGAPASSDLVQVESESTSDSASPDEVVAVSDDEQIDEITALVEQAMSADRAGDPTPHDAAWAPSGSSIDHGEIERSIQTAGEEPQPLARLDLRLADYDDDALRRVVKESEALVIAEMVRSGQLTSSGELTERDIASMVFLSYTSEEMLEELRLRKAIDDTDRNQPGEVASTERALAPLKNIE